LYAAYRIKAAKAALAQLNPAKYYLCCHLGASKKASTCSMIPEKFFWGKKVSKFLQDMLVPIGDLGESLKCFHDEVEIYPIWLCPFKLPNNPGMLKTTSGDQEMYVTLPFLFFSTS
jgi:hypothetical protein